jgi:hypothetical protein
MLLETRFRRHARQCQTDHEWIFGALKLAPLAYNIRLRQSQVQPLFRP